MNITIAKLLQILIYVDRILRDETITEKERVNSVKDEISKSLQIISTMVN